MNQQANRNFTKRLLAETAKLFLLVVANPATRITGHLGRVRHDGTTAKYPPFYFLIAPAARAFNWAVQGAITLSQPAMSYDPVAWRRRRLNSQWASRITGIAEEDLESQTRDYLFKQQAIPHSSTASDASTFTILVGFHSHLDYLKDCIDSVVAAAERSPDIFIELLLVNDDPSVSTEQLVNAVSHTPLQSLILCNKANLGICRSINEAMPHAKGEWILHLDCDDRIAPNAIAVIQRAIRENLGCRFISSRSVDIDETGKIMAYRLRDQSPVDLIHNNYASHLKAIRRDLHDEIGGFNPLFEGCQDFEFALRTAAFESLLFIPEYLYQYRWHGSSQTVGNCDHQNDVMIRVRQTYLLAIQWILNGPREILIRPFGKHAQEWAKKIPSLDGHPAWSVDLEATSPFSQNLYKILLIRIAGETVFAVSTGVLGQLPGITI
jgi:glycosyltransferase involved in cell wall biosynthesis